jgi:alpha-1,6-mannosyltransferase
MPRLEDRRELARLLASADALVHGCEAETFCLVAAEARASGLPMIVPDRGATLDLLAPHAGTTYRAGNEASLESALVRFVDAGVELQRAAAARASNVRSMDEHFAELFGRYAQLAAAPRRTAWAAATREIATAPELALARSAITRS